jgi:hypothetical protein
MAKIRFWKWQYTDPLGKQHVTRSLLSRGPAPRVVDDPDRAEWTLPLGDRPQKPVNDIASRTPK